MLMTLNFLFVLLYIGNKIVNDYLFVCDIGRGSFSDVKKVIRRSDQTAFAMKIMSKSILKKKKFVGRTRSYLPTAARQSSLPVDKDCSPLSPSPFSPSPLASSSPPDDWLNVEREIAILKRLDHPNIIKLYEVIDDSNHDYIYLGNYKLYLLISILILNCSFAFLSQCSNCAQM